MNALFFNLHHHITIFYCINILSNESTNVLFSISYTVYWKYFFCLTSRARDVLRILKYIFSKILGCRDGTIVAKHFRVKTRLLWERDKDDKDSRFEVSGKYTLERRLVDEVGKGSVKTGADFP